MGSDTAFFSRVKLSMKICEKKQESWDWYIFSLDALGCLANIQQSNSNQHTINGSQFWMAGIWQWFVDLNANIPLRTDKTITHAYRRQNELYYDNDLAHLCSACYLCMSLASGAFSNHLYWLLKSMLKLRNVSWQSSFILASCTLPTWPLASNFVRFCKYALIGKR